jgi:hypothetical protein
MTYNLRWTEVDFDRAKTGRKSIVLNAPALAVLAALPRAGDYVVHGDSPTTATL